jgi:hypothetical protein
MQLNTLLLMILSINCRLYFNEHCINFHDIVLFYINFNFNVPVQYQIHQRPFKMILDNKLLFSTALPITCSLLAAFSSLASTYAIISLSLLELELKPVGSEEDAPPVVAGVTAGPGPGSDP